MLVRNRGLTVQETIKDSQWLIAQMVERVTADPNIRSGPTLRIGNNTTLLLM